MTVHHIRTGATKIDLLARGTARIKRDSVLEAAGGLFPYRHSVWDMDPWRMGNGWPQSVPECDISGKVIISCEGEVLADREQPRGIQTSAVARWTADDELWEQDIFRWYPVHSSVPVFFEGFSGDSPVLDLEYEYRVGNEVFLQPGLVFDADAGNYLMADLGSTVGGTYGYSMIMVASLNTPDSRQDYGTIWAHEHSSGWVILSIQGNALYLQSDGAPRKMVLQIADLLSSSQPLMLALVMGRPFAKVYACAGPSVISSGKIETGTEYVAMNPVVRLGNDDEGHQSDMTVFDLGVYQDQLTDAQVREEFAILSSAFGGDK